MLPRALIDWVTYILVWPSSCILGKHFRILHQQCKVGF